MERQKGSIRFIHKGEHMTPIAGTLGRIGSLPQNILYGTPEASFQNPSEERVKEMGARFANTPVEGNIEVYMGFNPLWRQVGRLELGKLFAKSEKKERRSSYLARLVLGLPSVFGNAIASSVARRDTYNPWTESATVFHPSQAIAVNRAGMALTYDRAKRPTVRSLSQVIPGVYSLQEFEASLEGVGYLSPAEQKEAGKILEPRFMMSVADSIIPYFGRSVSTLGAFAIEGTAAVIGHVHARKSERPLFAPAPSRRA